MGRLTMELMVNDLSIHGQFISIESFHKAINQLMILRLKIKQLGHELYCHKEFVNVLVTKNVYLIQAIQSFELNERRAFLQWITRFGPFWENDRVHSSEDYIECNGDIVTDTAIGETAIRKLQGRNSQLISITPSSWNFSPIMVCLIDDKSRTDICIPNHFNIQSLQMALAQSTKQIKSWAELELECRKRFINITFSEDAFSSLYAHPFVYGAASTIVDRIGIISQLKKFSGESEEEKEKRNDIYQKYFVGEKAPFSDSSDTEKRNFSKELTFKDPNNSSNDIFCPWHGKIKSPQIRIHFSWPISAEKELSVVYVGPKITKK